MTRTRFLLGALAAGVVLNASGIFLAHFLLASYVEALIERMGALADWAPISHLSMRFAFAAAALTIWSFVRRAVAGRLAAVSLTALLVWVLTNPVPLEMWHVHAGLSGGAFWLAALWGFAEIWLAILVGSWIAGGRGT